MVSRSPQEPIGRLKPSTLDRLIAALLDLAAARPVGCGI
jgi:hypothetical protein